MATAIITIGAVLTGKTSFAESVIESDDSYVIISRDDIRYNLFPHGNHGYKFTPDDEQAITSKQYDMIRECYQANKNVIVPNSNLRMGHLKRFIRILENYNFDVKIKLCEEPKSTIYRKRDLLDVKVTNDHIENQLSLYNEVKEKVVNNTRYSKYLML